MKYQWSFLILILSLEFLMVWTYYRPKISTNRESIFPDKGSKNLSISTLRKTFQEAKNKIKVEVQKAISSRGQDNGIDPVSIHDSYLFGQPRSQVYDFLQGKFEKVTKRIFKKLKPNKKIPETIVKYAIPATDLQNCDKLFKVSPCKTTSIIRRLNGTCNNLRNSLWGAAETCYKRLVPPDYADGISEKRIAKSGAPLPSPRSVSLAIHSNSNRPSTDRSHLFMVWGQFLDHDIAQTPITVGPNDEFIKCCPVSADNHPSCDPILLDKDDPFFRFHGITCLSNVRSAKCLKCTLGPREQINQVTAYIDASQIYGCERSQTQSLRTMDGSGLMKYVKIPEVGELPPGSYHPLKDECSYQDEEYDCFETGDLRANQHPGLISLHTIFLREHNRIARILRKMNSRWSGLRVFYMTRKIVSAEMQMITYNEFLPLVIGPEAMKRYNLNIRSDNGYSEYNENVDATLVSEFTTAAYRFGHSMINNYFKDSRGKNMGFYLKDIFSYPFGLYRGQLDGVVKGMTESPAQKSDRYLTDDVRNHLFQVRGNTTGLDLAALNINRGRDHGIPGYTTLVKFCNGPNIKEWKDLNILMDRFVTNSFEGLYQDVEDIDLFSGGLAEKAVEGGVVGPTFACIIGTQFQRLKFGDRYYFEHGDQTGSFTPAQLKEIKKVTFGRIICDNSKIKELQQKVFVYPNDENIMESCNEKPAMSLAPWKNYKKGNI